MEPFADLLDLESRWRALSDAEKGLAQTLLDDASAMVRAEKPTVDDLIEDGKLDAALPRMVVCAMVRRALSAPSDVMGVTQQQRTTGPFTMGVTYTNPDARLYWTKQDRRLLGVGRQRAFTVDTTPPQVAS